MARLVWALVQGRLWGFGGGEGVRGYREVLDAAVSAGTTVRSTHSVLRLERGGARLDW